MAKRLYKLVDGSHTRGEGGRKVTYESTDPERNLILLSAEEYSFLRQRVQAIDTAPSEAAKEPEPPAPPEQEPEPKPEAEPEAPPEPAPTPEPQEPEAEEEEEHLAKEEPATDYSEVLAGNVGDVTAAIEKMTDPEAIDALAEQEFQGKGGKEGGRKGVLNAARERLEALEGGSGG